MKFPKQSQVQQARTHRLIPYRYSDRGKPILNRIAQNGVDLLSDLTELEGATNDRLLGESGRLPGVSAIELVCGFRNANCTGGSGVSQNPRAKRNWMES